MTGLYSSTDEERYSPVDKKPSHERFRSPWRRDIARLIHCPSFRRLQGKTQIFPSHDSDFFRNRLTHSLEVAQIAKSIAIKLASTSEHFSRADQKLNVDLVEFAALAHDLGHPPFGHIGEDALDEIMVDYGGFEGNAQTLHILSRVEKKETQRKVDGEIRPFDHTGSDLRLGLNLTFRSLASVLKYDEGIPERKEDRKKPGRIKGYYLCDEQLVKEIKRHVVGREDIGNFKTVECSIMDIADDIAYSTYDLEDCFKADLLEPFGLFTVDAEIRKTVREKVNKRLDEYYSDIPATEREIDDKDILRCLFDVFGDLFTISADEKRELANRNTAKEWKKLISSSAVRQLSRKIADDGYERTRATSGLVERFIDGIEVLPHPEFPQLHRVRLRVDIFKTVEVLKNITFEAVILSPAMQLVEYRGKEVIHSIFKAIEKEEKKVHLLLPEDYRNIYLQAKGSAKKRIICDFISGMTDRYAWEFYNRLCGTIPSSIFDPVE